MDKIGVLNRLVNWRLTEARISTIQGVRTPIFQLLETPVVHEAYSQHASGGLRLVSLQGIENEHIAAVIHAVVLVQWRIVSGQSWCDFIRWMVDRGDPPMVTES